MKAILECLLPTSCVLCHEIISHQNILCNDCLGELPWQKSEPSFLALFHYQAPIDRFISQLKFQGKLIYARLFSQCFITYLQNHPEKSLPTALLPVPLHHRRLRERGFNQALEIAKPIAKKLKIPLIDKFCQRSKNTKPQTHLSAQQRAHNVKDAFIMKKSLHGQHVVILDDVVTTGSTVADLTALLQNHGVKKIEVWCVAKTKLL